MTQSVDRSGDPWETGRQLAQILAAVYASGGEASARQCAVEKAVEATGADAGALLTSKGLVASVGLPTEELSLPPRLSQATGGSQGRLQLPGIGPCAATSVPVDGEEGWLLLIARSGTDEIDDERLNLLRTLGCVLQAALHQVRLLERERSLRNESARQAAELERLASIIRGTTDFVGISDLQGNRWFLNSAGRRLLGIAEDEDITTRTITEDRPQWATDLLVKEGIPAAVQDGEWSGETAFLGPDGREIPFMQKIMSHKDPDYGEVRYLSTVARDLSTQRELEAQLRQSQKMDAIGRLAGGVAHDLNNFLAVILNYSTFVAEDLDEKSPLREDVNEIHRAGERAARLVRQLLQFSRKEVVNPIVLDLNEVVTDAARMVHSLIQEDVLLTVTASDDLWKIRMDRGQVEQLLLNLAMNARDAMIDGGLLEIKTANARIDQEYARANGDLNAGSYVCVAVADTGEGMTEEVRSRIFEPFFTTKPRGQGTGLGLATVYGIVKQANGHITVLSKPSVGTTFRVYLPATLEPDECQSVEPKSKWSMRGQGETILVVEDENAVRSLVVRLLSSAGYRVLSESSGENALELLDHIDHIDLLLTDVIMPGMSGKDLSLRTGLETLYMSGHTDQIIAQHGVLSLNESFVQKPFTSGELLTKVAECVARSSGRIPPSTKPSD